ncbi:MAG: hypothetical protein GJ680_19090 [Alteromonadaceae bacterium]|nr:hypothetical protein [Alteromonadaceae bacterium]
MKTKLSILFIGLFLLFSVGCNHPDENNIRLQYANMVGIKNINRVINFHKVNAWEANGTLKWHVKFDLIFDISSQRLIDAAKAETDEIKKGLIEIHALQLRMLFGNFQDGQKFPREDTLTLANSENGWKITDIASD